MACTGHVVDRIHIVLYGCLLWACMAWLFGLAPWAPYPLTMGYIVWAINGFGLSLVVPSTQSVVADYSTDDTRGTAFGCMFFLSAFGGLVGGAFALNLAGKSFGHVHGWQLVMFIFAIVSAAVGILNIMVAKDPKNVVGFPLKGVENKGSSKDIFKDILSIVRVPTFVIIIIQGVVGTMPWKIMGGYMILYLQLVGMSDAQTSAIQISFGIGNAFGALLGGFLGDKAAQRWPNHGRIFVCQFSVFMGIPSCLLNYMLLPRNGAHDTMVLYIILFFLQGLVISWAAPSCNNPIFAEIVPQKKRNLIYAFDRCFEGALSSPMPYFVGWAASSLFGFEGDATTTGIAEIDAGNANALGKAIVWFSVIPFMLCLAFYSGLHFTYHHDKVIAAYSALSSEVLPSSVVLESLDKEG